MSMREISLACLIFHTEHLIIMNLSIFELAYLGSQAKDTPHSGKAKMFRFADLRWIAEATDQQWMRQLGFLPEPDWPLAQLLWLAEPVASRAQLQSTHGQGLLLAQAVHFSLQRDSFGLDDLISLAKDEYLTLTQHLNNFFVDEGLTLIPSVTQQYWFLQTSTPWELSTHSIQSAMYQNIQGFMPHGQHAQKLRQVMNQVQMLLHEHPVNQQRIANGLSEVNSIWFSGNSGPEIKTSHKRIGLVGQHRLTASLAEAFQLTHFAHIDNAIAQGAQDALMLVDDMVMVDWDALFIAVKRRNIQRLMIHLAISGETLQLSLTPIDCWKFWRQPKSFETLVQQHVQTH
jgi:hypothetical protein